MAYAEPVRTFGALRALLPNLAQFGYSLPSKFKRAKFKHAATR
jgi:hypothetical protein